jgi:hypothetical protein
VGARVAAAARPRAGRARRPAVARRDRRPRLAAARRRGPGARRRGLPRSPRSCSAAGCCSACCSPP